MVYMSMSKEGLGSVVRVIAIAVAASWITTSTRVHADTVNCTPITVPVTIASPGVYCLAATTNLNLFGGCRNYGRGERVTLDFNDNAISTVMLLMEDRPLV